MFSYEDFIDGLLKHDFEKAKREIDKLSVDKRKETILQAGYDTESIIVYTFACYLAQGDRSYHEAAEELMLHVFTHIEGAYSAALYHLRQRYDNDTDNLDYLEMLLFFWSVPEKLIDDDEALRAAEKIIEREADNRIALNVIAKINKSST
ncbi:MAG: hypothetical protein K2K57_03950 [Oscillospiraceae bacterium]|nr:hypothetical protein [Oscillospiraceae bacterium]